MFARAKNAWNAGSFARLALVAAMIVAGAVVAFGIWAAAPLFYSTRIDESFPATAAQPAMTQPTAAMAQPTAVAMAQPDSAAMAEPTADAMTQPTAAAMAQPDSAAMTQPTADAMAQPAAVASGSFSRIDTIHGAEGTATIYQLESGKLVLRLENFKATNGPDLYVVLSGHPQPRSSTQVHEGGFVELARLKANEGNQNYELPDDLDLSTLKSAVIYCKAFKVVFSTAELRAAG